MTFENRQNMGLSEKPLISIVTVVLNNKESLERTIQSVIGQTYKNIDYIIIDGGSTDGTLDVIKKYKNSIQAGVSEPDKGIYEAMNKGIALARGEFINFLNAGDLFYENRTLEKTFQEYPYDAELIYGDCELVYGDCFSRVKKAGDTAELWKGMIFSHQSLFTRSALLKKYKFDTSLAMAADFDFIFSVYSKGHKFYNAGLIISSVLTGGRSDKYYLQAVTNWWQVVKKHRNNMKVNLYYSSLILDKFLISIIKTIFPRAVINLIYKFNKKVRCLVY